ncbi:hypothetical protein [Streptomyces sp. BF23-19]|uniref:hypothetical protein n=1 Tax=unclassified Streptomyces TaxID=2593676 RepID=UPI0034E3E60B
MSTPTIRIEQGERRYHYLWLKYVTGIDLTQHCARSLHGPYSRAVQADAPRDLTLTLDEHRHAIAFYLCGVTTNPYRWEDNPHLAFESAPGYHVEIQVKDLKVTLTDARPIPFTARHIPADDPHATDRQFKTCRNWQFAHHLRAAGVVTIPSERPRGLGTGSVAGQLPLM